MARVINARSPSGQLASIEIKDGRITAVTAQPTLISPAQTIPALSDITDFARLAAGDSVEAGGALLLPGLIDAHVHSRDPGMTHKESWFSLAASAFKGGVVAVCDMPNTYPPTVSRAAIEAKRARAEECGLAYRFYLGVTNDNLGSIVDLLDDPELPLCGLKVYYGASTGNMLFDRLDALGQALRHREDILVTFHAEDQAVIDANARGRPGAVVCAGPADFGWHSMLRDAASAASAVGQILAWARESGQRVHLAHVSTPKEAELAMAAAAQGVRVTMEVAPHHLFFSTDDYLRLGGHLKVNPPVRGASERDALRAMVACGQFDLFATDHAPHTLTEKSSMEYDKCPSGMPAVEFFAPLLLTFAEQMKMPLTDAVKMATCNPAQLFHWQEYGGLEAGKWASFVWVEQSRRVLRSGDISAWCGWSPYVGMELAYQVCATWHKGRRVFACKTTAGLKEEHHDK